MKTPIREYVKSLSQVDLERIFLEMENFEDTGSISETALLRDIASRMMANNAMAMTFVAHEVWRELYIRCNCK